MSSACCLGYGAPLIKPQVILRSSAMTPTAKKSLGRELSVGEVAERAGVAVSTLHFYEQKGLIRSRRSSGNQRRYCREVLRRVAVIKVAQRAGVPLADIGAALSALPDD